MPKATSHRTLSYRLHKGSGQAVVTLDGRECYLGAHGSEVSRARYDRLIAEWLSQGRQLSAKHDLAVSEMLSAFLRYARRYYRDPDGNVTGEVVRMETAIRPLRRMYGLTPAFGPLALQAVRQSMIDAGWSRKYINRHVGRIKLIFTWAASQELIPASVPQALRTVPGLRVSRTEARETDPVRPASEAHVDAIRPHVSRQVWALVQLQLFTGARPGELLKMRACDLVTTGSVLTYTPSKHKTAYRGHTRTIYLGPRAQEVVRPFLAGRPVDALLFSAAEAVAESRAARHAARQTPLSCGNRPGTNRKRKPKSPPRNHYTVHSYRVAIRRACDKAKIPRWHPHQLRHTAATKLRKESGVARRSMGSTCSCPSPQVND